MRKPVKEWDEDDVLSLPREDDTFERKGAMLLDLNLPRVDENAVRDELAKQLSAFANTGGGEIIYGVTNDGKIDFGGISRSVKGRQPTKEWLEDLIPILTELEVLGVNVYEIPRQSENSKIAEGKAIFVVDVPDSDRAPHQSRRDWRYYVRLGGKSIPAPHRMVEDIRNRQRHPAVTLVRSEILFAMAKRTNPATRECELRGTIRLVLENRGNVKAVDVALLTCAPNLSFFINNLPGLEVRFDARPHTLIWQLKQPVYPGFSVPLDLSFIIRTEFGPIESEPNLTLQVAGTEETVDEQLISWKIFADSAPVKAGEIRMGELCLLQRTLQNFHI